MEGVTRTVGASKTPLLMECGQAFRGDEQISPTNEMAKFGRALHEGMAAWIGSETEMSADELCEKHGCGKDTDDLRVCMIFARQIWSKVRRSFPAPICERFFSVEVGSDFVLEGVPDVLSVHGRKAIILDWKSGYQRRDYWAQMQSLAFLAVKNLDVDEVTVVLVWVRDRIRVVRSYSRQEILGFAADLLRAAHRTAFSPGAHCIEHFCPRQHDCPARDKIVRRAVGDLTGNRWNIQNIVDSGELPAFRAFIKAAKNAIKDAEVGVKGYVEDNQPVHCGGKVYTLDEQHRRVIDLRKAWPVMRSYIGERLPDFVKVSIGKVEKAIMEDQPKGQKAKVVKTFNEELESVGALSFLVSTRLAERADKEGPDVEGQDRGTAGSVFDQTEEEPAEADQDRPGE